MGNTRGLNSWCRKVFSLYSLFVSNSLQLKYGHKLLSGETGSIAVLTTREEVAFIYYNS
jgi:hypothetical protein